MVFFLIVILFIIFNQMEFAKGNTFMDGYLSRPVTTAVKGVFVILIIMSHWSQYVDLGGIYDEPYLVLKNHLNQMVVAMFLFYSGYGMMEATKSRGCNYIHGIPKKRFLTTLYNFDMAILVFIVVGYLLGNTYNLNTILWSLIGWKNVGNSSWYIFVILALYLLYYVSFLPLKAENKPQILWFCTIIFTLLVIGFTYFHMVIDRPYYSYNTIILFPFGCWYSLLKNQINKAVMKNDYTYLFTLSIIFAIYFLSFHYRWKYGIEGYSVWAITFTLLILLLTMKIKIGNPILDWFGNHVFSIYILQRIPMNILQHFETVTSHKYMYLILVIISTCLMAIVFEYFTEKIRLSFQSLFTKKVSP